MERVQAGAAEKRGLLTRMSRKFFRGGVDGPGVGKDDRPSNWGTQAWGGGGGGGWGGGGGGGGWGGGVHFFVF